MPRLYLKEVEPFITNSGKDKTFSDIPDYEAVPAEHNVGSQKYYRHNKTKRNTSLICTDALLLCIEFVQILGVIQAMSLKWIWPRAWIRATNFIFFFTADVWEYIKVDQGAFVGVRNYDVPSDSINTKFYYILLGWGVVLVVMATAWATVRIVLQVKQPVYLLMYNARLLRTAVFIMQFVALPFGVTTFKVFQCTGSDLLSVDNSIQCWSGQHWAYVIPVVISIILLYIVFPGWMFWTIRQESMASANRHHEDFLKLKEVEYMSGLDIVWAVKSLYLFSSFHLRGIYFRPVAHLFKLLLLIIYAASFQNTSGQAVGFAVVLMLVAVLMLALRPFRLTLFNVVATLGYFCLTGDVVFGAVITHFNVAEIESPWLVEPYSMYVLVGLNAVILVSIMAVFIIYLVGRHLCCRGRCCHLPLWPTMTDFEHNNEGSEMQKYLAAVLKGRALIEKCRRLPAMFVPVHEMANQICILNAYMRESEYQQNGLHSTLWAVLDEMIDMHQRLEPKSLFGDMVHQTIRKNAAHFVTLMPMFAQRLAQRDYDLILTSPVKKRLILKMYIVGKRLKAYKISSATPLDVLLAMFLEGTRQRKTHHVLTQHILNRIWEESPEVVAISEEREYGTELYPHTAAGPDMEALYSTGALDMGQELYSLETDDEEETLSSFLKRAPPKLLLLEDNEVEENKEIKNGTGTDNPSFIADDIELVRPAAGAADSQPLTKMEFCDHSEPQDDISIDPEAFKSQGPQMRSLKLEGHHPGESNTDAGGEGIYQGTRGRSNTASSLHSNQSLSSKGSNPTKKSTHHKSSPLGASPTRGNKPAASKKAKSSKKIAEKTTAKKK